MLYNLFLAFTVLSVTANAQTLIITHATVIDTVTGKTQPNTTVVIDKNRITGVIASSKANLKSGRVIDAKGQYLIPGLWDMHTHVSFSHCFSPTASRAFATWAPHSTPSSTPATRSLHIACSVRA
jgi:adenine deaminase